MAFKRLERGDTALLVIDIQERLFAHVERSAEMLYRTKVLVEGMSILGIPMVVTEQVPEKMGATLLELRECLPEGFYRCFSKNSFSCLGDTRCSEYLLSHPCSQWVLAGMEAHVCILQTAIDLLHYGKSVVILNDAVTSRSIYDYSTALAELGGWGARVTSVETVLFELLSNSEAPEFKQISQLLK